MQVHMSLKEIVDAIEGGELRKGNWAKFDEGRYYTCAVGAVIRRAIERP